MNKSTVKSICQLNGTNLCKSTQEQELGVLVSITLNPSANVTKLATKVHSVLGIIRHLHLPYQEILVPLYLSRIPLFLESGQWYLDFGISTKESNKTGARSEPSTVLGTMSTTGPQDYKKKGFEAIWQIFKLMRGLKDIPYSEFFIRNTNYLRGHSQVLAIPDHWRTKLTGNWFAIPVIDTPRERCRCVYNYHIENLFR